MSNTHTHTYTHVSFQSTHQPGWGHSGRGGAMTGDNWLLPANGRGYSWRQLSLDHAASGYSLLGWQAEMFPADLGDL